MTNSEMSALLNLERDHLRFIVSNLRKYWGFNIPVKEYKSMKVGDVKWYLAKTTSHGKPYYRLVARLRTKDGVISISKDKANELEQKSKQPIQ